MPRKESDKPIKKGINMKDEYHFTNAEQGKFYRPMDELEMPIYLDDEIKAFFWKKMDSGSFSLNEIIKAPLKKDIEVSKKLAP